MSIAIISGAAGLIGSEAADYFSHLGMKVIGIDNDMRKLFFGEDASTNWQRDQLLKNLKGYTHYDEDIRDFDTLTKIFKKNNNEIRLIIHAAAQPSHDWAAQEPMTDFSVNANGTLNLLECMRIYSPNAVFIFISTNKVYGDTPNRLPLIEKDTRWEINPDHEFSNGISEKMSIDQSLHSLFGASKVAADVMVQEYGNYFGLNTVSFRGGCLTGPNHSGAQLHGFLSYLMKCTTVGTPYKVFGYKGKQVRDNIHSKDLIKAIHAYYENPKPGEVYNIGGGRFSNCSLLEAIDLCQEITGNKLDWEYVEENRRGDHIWWISDISEFRSHFPSWNLEYNVEMILQEIYKNNASRWL
jgi:CDP-paratose 2-epimerase